MIVGNNRTKTTVIETKKAKYDEIKDKQINTK